MNNILRHQQSNWILNLPEILDFVLQKKREEKESLSRLYGSPDLYR
jgi:hypothetical protein